MFHTFGVIPRTLGLSGENKLEWGTTHCGDAVQQKVNACGSALQHCLKPSLGILQGLIATLRKTSLKTDLLHYMLSLIKKKNHSTSELTLYLFEEKKTNRESINVFSHLRGIRQKPYRNHNPANILSYTHLYGNNREIHRKRTNRI